MQEVTDLPFMRLMARYGGPDLFVTEYFRVTRDSKIDPYIVKSITQNDTGKPVIAQMIGQDIPHLIRTVRDLERHPIAGIDLNLGCPAPIVCRKDAGGGLLRYPERVDEIIGTLRDAIKGRFTVKCRVGFAGKDEFPRLLEVFQKHAIDGLSIHGRTVHDAYKTPVHPECVAMAAAAMPCPVIANGNVVDVSTGLAYMERTRAAGLMIGRGAIRHPWLFQQLRAHWEGTPMPLPGGRDLLGYIHDLYDATASFQRDYQERHHVQRMKRYMIFIAAGIGDGRFEYSIRRMSTKAEFFDLCRSFLDHDEPLLPRPPEDSKVFCGFSAFDQVTA